MRKDVIRQAVATHLAMIGYAAGSYAWVRSGRKSVCRILAKPDAKLSYRTGDALTDNPVIECFIELHLPAGKTSRKALNEALALVPTKGAPKPVARPVAKRSHVQLDAFA
jgi:hypothetical protein